MSLALQAGTPDKNWEVIDGEFRAGKKTTTLYRPENTPLRAATDIEASVYYWQNYGWRGEDLQLQKTDSGWVSTVQVPKNAALVVYKYSADGKSDNGGKNMYAYFTVDKKGRQLPSSYTGWALLRNKNTQMYSVPDLMKDSTDMWIDDEVLRFAACLEEHFPHSMANAVVRAAKERNLAHEEVHSEVEYIVAHGIASRVSGERVVIGSYHFVFEDEHCIVPADEQEKFDRMPAEYSHLYMAASGQLVGVICIADPLRPEAASVLRQLHKLGIRNAVMMTGDSYRTAEAIAKQVGVDQFYAEVLPEDKANFVQKEKAAGHTVVMIGDGINDSPALSAADIGIAINSGAAIACEIADVTIKADSLEELVFLKTVANALQHRVSANYRFVLSFNSTLILLGALGILQPAASAMLHNLSTLGISLKSMTNLVQTPSSVPQIAK